MDVDFDLALMRVNVAIARALKPPGPLGPGIPAAIEALSNPDLANLPQGEARVTLHHLMAKVKTENVKAMPTKDIEEIVSLMFALQTQIEKERKAFRDRPLLG